MGGAFLGAAASLAAALLMYQFNAPVHLEMDRDIPVIATGLYGAEHVDGQHYAWSRRDNALHLPGLDRAQPWTCTVVIKGGRSDPSTLPEVVLTVDGVVLARHRTTNDYQAFSIDLPVQATRGAVIGMSVSNTFQPSSQDNRALGVMVDRWVCDPAAGQVVGLPPAVSRAAIITGAVFGVAFVALGASWVVLAPAVIILGAGVAVPLTLGPGAFSPGLTRGTWLAAVIALALTTAGIVWRTRGVMWSAAGRMALAWTGGLVLLKLLMLFHPLKPLIDAVFHAHRVQWILDGRYFFSQTMPSGVQMPYAIGLYVFAAPWTAFTSDIVSLIRIIVVVADAAGSLLLYGVIVRRWRDPQTAALAAVLFSLVPLPFVIIGNANMTNVFGQAIALAAVASAVAWRLQPRDVAALTGFTVITTTALLSHISTLTLLAVTLGALAVGYWWRGDREVKRSGTMILACSAVAALVAVLAYYIQFIDEFRSALVVRQAGSAAAEVSPVSLMDRVREAGGLIVTGVGWPVLGLALAGCAAFRRHSWRDRLDLGVWAWMVTAIVCIGIVVVTPVDRAFLRYAAEFISRVIFATSPGLVVLAALGGTAVWRRGGWWRLPAAVAVFAALWVGLDAWLQWLR